MPKYSGVKHLLRHSKIKLSVLVIATVIAGIVLSTVACTVFFGLFYDNAMFNSAYTTSKQSVNQTNVAVTNFVSSVKFKVDELANEFNNCKSIDEFSKSAALATKLEDDVYAVVVYDQNGKVLAYGSQSSGKIKSIGKNLSFDKQAFDSPINGYALTSPHVQTLFYDSYPWVVTIAKKQYSQLFKQQVYVTADFKFSDIANYVDKVSIGQHGYCYITDGSSIVYHPQQQMLFSGIKNENVAEVSKLSDGIHRQKDNIYNISTVEGCNWKIVGVSFNNEITQSVKAQMITGASFAVLCCLLVSAIIYLLLSKTLTRPVRRLIVAMQNFEKQADTFKYEADRANVVEFQTLSESFEHMVHMIQSLMEKVHNEEVVLRKTELKALQAQINPHFLYNTLDSIQWMCEQGNNEEAVQMVGALAKLFRISISHGNELITIRDELRHSESYLIIQSFRYKNQFTYKFDVDESLLDCLCNKITIQPFIENAIYHGLDRMVDEGEIKISVEKAGEDILIKVVDNGVGMTEEQCQTVLQKDRSDSHGIGVKNVNDRLKIYFGEQYGITIESELDVGTCVTIKIPYIEKGRQNEF